MQFIDKWKKQIESFTEANERAITCTLLGIALVLILIALFGKTHHKAMAMIYVVL